MKVYSFTLCDDLLGWDNTENYISDFTKEEITSLWEITKSKCFADRLAYIKENAKLLGKTFDTLKVDKGFSMYM